MGLLDGIKSATTEQEYYDGKGLQEPGPDGFGGYQFTSLQDIINQFYAVYVGKDKIISSASRIDIIFHAKRALAELSFDTLKSCLSQEITVPASLQMVLPRDYVNYTKVVRVDSNGVEKILYPTGKTSNPFPIGQNSDSSYKFSDQTSELSLNAGQEAENTRDTYASTTRSSFSTIPTSNPNQDSDVSDTTTLDNRGRRYGLDPQHTQSNGTFYIDNATGFIHFSSDLAGSTVTLKYISDGLGTDDEMVVHKFAEEAVYKHIMYGLISNRTGISESIVLRYKKERFAETRKAKIRLSNIKMEEFTQVLRGISKHIK